MATPRDIIAAAAEVGIEITVKQNCLALTGDLSRLTGRLRAAIRREAHGLHIHQTGRLRACSDLYRYLPVGSRVTTPHGEGKVLQVFADRVTIHIDTETKTRFYHPSKITLNESVST